MGIAAGWSGPQLTQQLVYLLQLFALYTSGSHGSSSSRGSSGHTAQIQQLLSSPEADLVDGLLLTERDEGPLPPDVSGQGYAERDVQVGGCLQLLCCLPPPSFTGRVVHRDI